MYFARDGVNAPLYFVASVFNPARFKARWEHFRNFAPHIVNAGGKLITVEVALNDRSHVLSGIAPEGDGHQYVRLTATHHSELWLKENAQNIGVARLPSDWKYVAFPDADLQFARPDIVTATLHALQHFDVVQMYSHIVAGGPDHVPISVTDSFAYQHTHGLLAPAAAEGYGSPQLSTTKRGFGTPGGAWAWRRSAFDAVGGLIDHAILGAADHYMARALIGQAESALDPRFTNGYRNPVLSWQARAEDKIRRNVGYIDGTVWHYWHGGYASRRYGTRAQILIRNQFDPAADLRRDWQGLIALADNKPRLRDDIRRYFSERNEDDVRVDGGRLVGPKPIPDWDSQ